MSSPGSFGRGRGYGVRIGIDYNQWQKRAEGLAAEARRKEQRIQQLYDSIREYERRTEAFGGRQLPIDLAQNLRNSIQQYEQLSGSQYEGRGREIAGLMPFRGAPRISSSVSTGGSRGPSAASQARQAERAAIRSQKQQESQQLQDAKWLSNYETRRADLERRSKQGNAAQDRYDAQQELIKLELERQRRETRMPGYETPAQAARRAATESETAKRTSEMDRQSKITEANQQLDRLIAALDQNTEAGAIAEINKLRPQLDKGASPESIIRQAQAKYKSAEELRKKKRDEDWEDWKRRTDYTADKVNARIREQQTFQKEQQDARIAAQRELQAGSMSGQSVRKYEEYRNKAAANRAYWEGLLNALPPQSETELPEVTKLRDTANTAIAGFQNTETYWAKVLEDIGAAVPAAPVSRASQYTQDNPAQPKTQSEYDALPPGSYFIGLDGETYIKN